MSDLRQDQRAATRRPDRRPPSPTSWPTTTRPSISVPAVAERAGVGVATVYRYFPTKEELLDAAAGRRDHLRRPACRRPSTSSVRPWRRHGTSCRPSCRWCAGSSPRRSAGTCTGGAGRPSTRRCPTGSAPEGVDPDSAAGRRLLGVADVLTSSTALLELHDKAGVPADQAAEWCTWAVAQLLRATIEEAT